MLLPQALRKRVLERISPTASEAQAEKRFALALAERLARAFNAKTTKKQTRVKVHFVGSTARDTGLRGDKDVDLFVSFPRSKTRDEIVARTIAVTKKTIRTRWEMHYAEHPYLQGDVKNDAKDGNGEKFEVEVIPCFATKPHEKLKSAVDRSPLHMLYLQKRLTKTQREDVRLLKQLLKAREIYGAESRVGGFSGLLCEYLVLNYRSLENLMTNAANWKPQIIIDMEGHYANAAPSFPEPLVFIDAIDKNRNAAAPVTRNALDEFILLAREYAKTPKEALFFPKKRVYSREQVVTAMKKRGTDFLLVEFAAPRNLVDDILWPQLARTTRSLEKQLKNNDWKVRGTRHFIDEENGEAFILIELESIERPRVAKILGPPVEREEDVKRFMKAHANALKTPRAEKGRVVAEEKRGVTNAVEFLRGALRSPVKVGVASHLRAALRKARFRVNAGALDGETLGEIAKHLF